MKLRQLFEQQRKVAVAAFGRMNPPTIGHEKLVNKIKSVDGDHYLFLSQTQKPKDNPLPFDVKLEFSKKFFPSVNVGHPTVRTPIQMLQMLEQLGYTDVVYVAGSDRVESFEKLFNDYNGKEYNFDSIKVISAGERDPDADGAEGMSASKMRAAAASGDFESFAQGVPTPALAQKLYDAVRKGMGVKDVSPVGEATIDESKMSFQDMSKNREFAYTFRQYVNGNASKDQVAELVRGRVDNEQFASEVYRQGVNRGGAKGARIKELADYIRQDSNIFDLPGKAFKKIKKFAGMGVKDTAPSEGVAEASYEGNLGLMELFAFFSKAEKTDPDLVAKVKSLIKQGQDKQVWHIVQDYTGAKLVGKEFEGSIAEAIIERACKSKRKSRG